jgi:hypothetical protein
MALSTDQLVDIRRQIGDTVPPSDADLNAIYDRTGDVDELVREVLERRLATLLASPAQFSVAGEYSQSTAANIEALRKQLGDLPGGLTSVRVVEAPAPRPR